MLSAVAHSNEIHIDHAISFVLATGRKSIGMIGLSFKGGTDDLRESPLVVMAERFIGKGLKLKIYDPMVSISRLIGANRRYIEDTIPHIESPMCDELPALIDESQVLVVGLQSDAIVEEPYQRSRGDHVILDLVNLSANHQPKGTYRGVCW